MTNVLEGPHPAVPSGWSTGRSRTRKCIVCHQLVWYSRWAKGWIHK